MPASIRGRLDLMPEEYLRQFCGSSALALCCDADNMAVHAACTPCHVVCVRSHRGCDRCAVACCPHGRRGCCHCAAPTPPGAFACAAPAAQPVAVSAATSVATATTGRPVVQVAPSQPLFTPALPFGEPQWPLRRRNLCSSCCLARLCRLVRLQCCRPCSLGPPLFLLLCLWSRMRRTSCWRRRLPLLGCRAR